MAFHPTRRSLLRGAALGGAAALALGVPNVLRAQEKRDLRLGIITPPGHPWNVAAEAVGRRLAEETGGRLSFTVFPSGQLGNEAAMLQQMQSGALDLGWIMTAEFGARVPRIAAINAPWIVDSTPKVARLMRDPLTLSLLDTLPQDTGTVGLAYGITTMRVVFSARPIEGLDDLAGMKLRINTTPAYRDFYGLLGATPTPIPTPAVFDAMSNGQVDGLEADLDFSWNQRFDRVSKTMLRMNAIFMPVIALASGRVWRTIDPADRELITRLTKEALSAQIDETVANEPKLVQSFTEAGIPIREVEVAGAEEIVARYDAMWQPKAPVLADLRKLGATL